MSENDFKVLGTPTALDGFCKQIAKVTQEYAAKRIPFCEPCCRLEFRDKLEEAAKESERRYGFIKEDALVVTAEQFEKFGGEDKFELLEDQQDSQDKVIEGSRTQVVIGHTLSYRCKKRGHGVSLFIPIEEYNKMKLKKDKPKKEE